MSSKKHYTDKTYRIFISLLCLILFLAIHKTAAVPAADPPEKEEVNYCNDDESWKEWEDLVIKYPNDEDITILHALRLGLCRKVSRGDITVQEATDIFEKFRTVIIDRKKATTKKDIGGVMGQQVGEKGIISQEEFYGKLKAVQKDYQKRSSTTYECNQ